MRRATALSCALLALASPAGANSDHFTEVAKMVTQSAEKHGVPVAVAHAVVQIESRYQCDARSAHGARGLMQVMPRTARGVGVTGNLTDCATGLEAGMRYLSEIIARHGVSCASLGLYQRGAYASPRCTSYGARAMGLAGK